MGTEIKVRAWWTELGKGMRVIRKWNWPWFGIGREQQKSRTMDAEPLAVFLLRLALNVFQHEKQGTLAAFHSDSHPLESSSCPSRTGQMGDTETAW